MEETEEIEEADEETINVKISDNNVSIVRDTAKCIECGICSYVCPAKINVREYVRKAKENYNEKI